MADNKDPFTISDLEASLPAAAAALSAEDRAGLVNALKDKLQNLAGRHSDILENLSPLVRKRVEFLKHIQSQHDELKAKFLEERKALEAKYQKLYEPFYTKRYGIVNGLEEVEGLANEAIVDREEERATEEKGVPDFWLTAMKTNEVLAEEITERDEGALKFLKDIKWHRINDPEGFKLEFYFDTNPYFKNPVLTKTYHMIEDDDDPILEKAIGTEIEWYTGKCLTQKVLKKKPRKGSKNPKPPITKIENCESFFTFFSPPVIPEEEDDLDDDTAEELQDRMEQDYNIGTIIRDKIIPHAISWFLGEIDGVDEDDESDDECDDNEENEDDDNDEDEDEDEDEEEEEDRKDRKKPLGGPKKSRGAKAGEGQKGEQASECKQQ